MACRGPTDTLKFLDQAALENRETVILMLYRRKEADQKVKDEQGRKSGQVYTFHFLPSVS